MPESDCKEAAMNRFRTLDCARLVVFAVALVAAIAGSPLAAAQTVMITFATPAAEGTTEPAID
jgi:hypothetical protein